MQYGHCICLKWDESFHPIQSTWNEMRYDKNEKPFFFTFKGLSNSPIFQYLNFSFHRHFKFSLSTFEMINSSVFAHTTILLNNDSEKEKRLLSFFEECGLYTYSCLARLSHDIFYNSFQIDDERKPLVDDG